MAEIENVFSDILSRWHRLEVMVSLRKDLRLEAVAYNKVGDVIMQRVVNFTEIRGRNTLVKHLENSLAKAAVIKQTRQYKHSEKELRWGEITAIDSCRNFYIETEVVPGKKIIAVCPFFILMFSLYSS